MKNKFRLEHLFVLLTLVFGTLFAIFVPPNEVPDEESHFARVYGILHGNFTVNRVTMPESTLRVLKKYSNFFSNGPKVDFNSYLADFAENKTNPNLLEFYPASSYFPILYTPQILGLGLGELLKLSELTNFFLGRFFSVLLYVFVGYFILRKLPFLKGSFFLVLTMPMSIYLAASYSADAVQIILTLLYISMVILELHSQALMLQSRKVALILVGSLLALTKPVSLLIILLSFAIPTNRFGDKKNKLIFVTIQFALGILVTFVWSRLTSSNVDASTFLPGVSPAKQLLFILFNPFTFIKAVIVTTDQKVGFFSQSFVGLFGWLTTRLPEFVYFLFAFALCVALFKDTKDHFTLTKPQRYIFSVVFLLYFVAVMMSMYLFSTPLGYSLVLGVQGRYFIPVFPLLFCLILSSIKWQIYVTNWVLTGLISMLMPVILALSLQTIYLKFYVPCGEYFYNVSETCTLPIDLPAERPIGEITKSVTQTFTAECNDITGVDVYFATYARQNKGSLNVSLRNETSNTLVFEKNVNVAKLRDNEWKSFTFPLIQNVSHHKFALTLTPRDSTPGNAVTVWATASDIYSQGELSGVESQGDLVFRYVCRYGIMHEIREFYKK